MAGGIPSCSTTVEDVAINYVSLMQCRRAAKFSDQQFEQDFVKAIQPLL